MLNWLNNVQVCILRLQYWINKWGLQLKYNGDRRFFFSTQSICHISYGLKTTHTLLCWWKSSSFKVTRSFSFPLISLSIKAANTAGCNHISNDILSSAHIMHYLYFFQVKMFYLGFQNIWGSFTSMKVCNNISNTTQKPWLIRILFCADKLSVYA